MGMTALPLGPVGTLDLKEIAVAEYLKASPPYLDGSMPGDIGFDPLCLTALAKPTPDAVKNGLTATARQAPATIFLHGGTPRRGLNSITIRE